MFKRFAARSKEIELSSMIELDKQLLERGLAGFNTGHKVHAAGCFTMALNVAKTSGMRAILFYRRGRAYFDLKNEELALLDLSQSESICTQAPLPNSRPFSCIGILARRLINQIKAARSFVHIQEGYINPTQKR